MNVLFSTMYIYSKNTVCNIVPNLTWIYL